jgi:hypothetical protein
MKQTSFASLEYAGKKRKTPREVFLAEMDRVVPWQRLRGFGGVAAKLGWAGLVLTSICVASAQEPSAEEALAFFGAALRSCERVTEVSTAGPTFHVTYVWYANTGWSKYSFSLYDVDVARVSASVQLTCIQPGCIQDQSRSDPPEPSSQVSFTCGDMASRMIRAAEHYHKVAGKRRSAF